MELLNNTTVDILDSKLIFFDQSIDFGFLGSANVDVNIVNSLLRGADITTCTPMLVGSNNTELALRNVTIISDGHMYAPTPFPNRATQIDLSSGSLDIANTALIYDRTDRAVPMIFLGPGVTLTNRTNNFATDPPSAAVLGGDTKSGDAGLIDTALCQAEPFFSSQNCVPAASGQLFDMGRNNQAVDPRSNQPVVVDQTGRPRIAGSAVDIGALEALEQQVPLLTDFRLVQGPTPTSVGPDLCGTGHEAINFTGHVGSAGNTDTLQLVTIDQAGRRTVLNPPRCAAASPSACGIA